MFDKLLLKHVKSFLVQWTTAVGQTLLGTWRFNTVCRIQGPWAGMGHMQQITTLVAYQEFAQKQTVATKVLGTMQNKLRAY